MLRLVMAFGAFPSHAWALIDVLLKPASRQLPEGAGTGAWGAGPWAVASETRRRPRGSMELAGATVQLPEFVHQQRLPPRSI